MSVTARRRPERVVAAVCAVLYAVFIVRPSVDVRGTRWFTLFDDAMISMTYARNLADGHGLVWNPGGPAVEGYTNPLWTVVMAGLHKVGLSEALVPLAVSVVSAALLIGCILLAAAIARRLAPDSTRGPTFAAVLVGVFYPLVYWSLRGMEVGLVTFLILAGVVLLLRLRDEVRWGDLALLCLVVAAGVSTRDDFVVPAIVFGIWVLVVLRGRARLQVAGALVATGLVVIGGQVAFRLAYYGEPLPNTYYLKVANQPVGSRWWRGLMSLVATVLADLLVLLGVVAVGVRRRATDGGRRVDAPIGLVLGLAVSLSAYSIYVGGDAWEWARLANRYLTPAVVLLLVLAGAMADAIAARLRASTWALSMVIGFVAVAVYLGTIDSAIGVWLHGVLEQWLGQTPSTTDSVAVATLVLAVVLGVAVAVHMRPLPASLRKGAALPVIVVASLAVSVTGNAWLSWFHDGGFYTQKNGGALAYGLVLEQLTDPGASIAVIWAGSPIYYAHRDGVDLLGKMDPVIAHGPHHEGAPMYPGHDKWDFDHSIGQLRPDVIAQYAWFTPADVDRFVAEGYQPVRLRPGVADDVDLFDTNTVPRALLWVRSDSPLVHHDAVEPISVDEAKRISVEPR